LDYVREPLKVGEAISVRMSSKTGDLWVSGVVSKVHQSRGTFPVVSFEVQAESESGEPFEMSGVPPDKLRRRFSEGDPVDVYRGTAHGWVPAVVSSPASGAPAQGSNPSHVSVLLSKSNCIQTGHAANGLDSIPIHLVRSRPHHAY